MKTVVTLEIDTDSDRIDIAWNKKTVRVFDTRRARSILADILAGREDCQAKFRSREKTRKRYRNKLNVPLEVGLADEFKVREWFDSDELVCR